MKVWEINHLTHLNMGNMEKLPDILKSSRQIDTKIKSFLLHLNRRLRKSEWRLIASEHKTNTTALNILQMKKKH